MSELINGFADETATGEWVLQLKLQYHRVVPAWIFGAYTEEVVKKLLTDPFSRVDVDNDIVIDRSPFEDTYVDCDW